MLTVTTPGMAWTPETLEHVFEPFLHDQGTWKRYGHRPGHGLRHCYPERRQHPGLQYAGQRNDIPNLLAGRDRTGRKPRRSTSRRSSGRHGDDPGSGGRAPSKRDHPDFSRDYGYRVLEAVDANEALRIAKTATDPIHLTLTDVIMPGMSGRQLAEQIVSARPGMKVVYMTGYTDDMVIQHNVLEPGVALLQKPFDKVQLARRSGRYSTDRKRDIRQWRDRCAASRNLVRVED